MVIWVNTFQTELMVEIYSRNLDTAIGKVITHEIELEHQFETHIGDGKWPLFVNKQLFRWSASITLDNNNAVLTDL